MSADELSQPAMGQCAVTGKIVPEDELVMIQGQRVCAEGKAILLERLKAGESLPGEGERPTVLRRFGCIFVDGLIMGGASSLIGLATGVSVGFNTRNGSADPLTAGVITLIAQSFTIVYFGLLHGSRGQSLGKMAGKLVVVKQDGSPIDMGTAFIRALAYGGPGYANGVALLTGNVAFVGMAGIIVGAYGLIDLLCALFDRSQQRALHDRIAGTRVINKV